MIDGTVVGNQTQIEVLQTGGTANGITSPAMVDEPLMDVGENYLLCLTYSPADEQYQAYYLPTGGGQGIISFSDIASAEVITNQSNATGTISAGDSGLAQVISRAEVVFDNGEYGCCQPMSGSFGDSNDPKSGGHWEQHSANYYIYDTLSLSITEETRIRQAFASWSVPDFSFTETTDSVSPNILLFHNSYGNNTWEARTEYKMSEYAGYTIEHEDIKGYFYQIQIRMNTDMIDNYNGTKILGIITHEAGHALGMAHVNPLVRTDSVMISSSSNRVCVSPTDFDLDVVTEIYGSHDCS